MSVLDRVQRLIALASSSNENEARNAAYIAVKLIRENNLIISEPGGSRPRKARPNPFEGLSDFEDIFYPEPKPRHPPPRKERRVDGRTAVYDQEGQTWWESPPSSYGTCPFCKKPYEAKDTVVTKKGEKTYHKRCWERRFVFGERPIRDEVSDDDLNSIFSKETPKPSEFDDILNEVLRGKK